MEPAEETLDAIEITMMELRNTVTRLKRAGREVDIAWYLSGIEDNLADALDIARGGLK